MPATAQQGNSRRTCGTMVVGSALASLLAIGCSGGRLYRAADLPVEFLAPQVENAQTLDLSRLAGSAVSSERIDRGDVLDVTIDSGYGNERGTLSEHAMPVRVGEDGYANVSLVGRLQLAGLELEGAEQVIATACVEKGLFRNPSVTVTMRRQRVNRVTVVGAVKKEGIVELPRGSSNLLEAIVAAEGLSKEAGTDVEVRHPGSGPVVPGGGPGLDKPDKVATSNSAELTSFTQPVRHEASSYRINLASAAKEGTGGYTLEDGDVVMIEKRVPKPVHVIGLVNKPGQFELPPNQNLHVLDVVALAGGTSSQVADKVHVIRQIAAKDEPVVVEVSLQEAKRQGRGNLRLAPGDVVSVEQTPTTVFLETLKTFIHFGFGATFPIVK